MKAMTTVDEQLMESFSALMCVILSMQFTKFIQLSNFWVNLTYSYILLKTE